MESISLWALRLLRFKREQLFKPEFETSYYHIVFSQCYSRSHMQNTLIQDQINTLIFSV